MDSSNTMSKKEPEDLKEYEVFQYKSPFPPAETDKCLVTFHNCTNCNVSIYWIDWNGDQIKYPTLKPKQSMHMDTYRGHLWCFRTYVEENDKMRVRRVLAVSEELLDSHCHATNDNYMRSSDRQRNLEELRSLAKDICPLCRYVLRTYLRIPEAIPCHHYSGRAKLSSTDLAPSAFLDHDNLGPFIYGCTGDTHDEEHCTMRRNCYLVDPFYNLRERCFMKLSQGHSDKSQELLGLDMPKSIVREYIMFTRSMNL